MSLQSAEQQQYDDNHQYDTKDTAWAISPTAAVGPDRNDSKQCKDNDDEEYCS